MRPSTGLFGGSIFEVLMGRPKKITPHGEILFSPLSPVRGGLRHLVELRQRRDAKDYFKKEKEPNRSALL